MQVGETKLEDAGMVSPVIMAGICADCSVHCSGIRGYLDMHGLGL